MYKLITLNDYKKLNLLFKKKCLCIYGCINLPDKVSFCHLSYWLFSIINFFPIFFFSYWVCRFGKMGPTGQDCPLGLWIPVRTPEGVRGDTQGIWSLYPVWPPCAPLPEGYGHVGMFPGGALWLLISAGADTSGGWGHCLDTWYLPLLSLPIGCACGWAGLLWRCAWGRLACVALPIYARITLWHHAPWRDGEGYIRSQMAAAILWES